MMHEGEQERIVLEEALCALEEAIGVHGRVVVRESLAPGARLRADALVAIDIDGRSYDFVAEVKTLNRFVAVGQVKALLDALIREYPGHLPLLIARFLTPRMAEACRSLNLPYIDTAGNAYLRAPGLFIHMAGRREPEQPQRDTYRASTEVGLKMIFALLSNPAWLGATYREIARRSDVALGAVGPVLRDLEARGFIHRTRTKDPILENKTRLFNEWVARYPELLRPKLGVRRYQTNVERLLNADLIGFKSYWGGEKAAELLTSYLHPERYTVYTRKQNPELLKALRMRLDAQGNTEVLEAFWSSELDSPGKPVVPPMLVYADLMTTGIVRNVEAAKLVYEQFIEPAFAAD